ncbi:MAG: capsular biosynthesis protein [Clostridia bacterium]|nr:capsular biosynthesis protein [Clostridia bacterium]
MANKVNTAPARNNSDEIEIDLSSVFEAAKKYWAVLVAATLVCALLGFLASNFFMTKKYSASVEMIVNTTTDADLVSSDQINSAKNLVSTYSVIITGSNVLTQVIRDLKLDMTYETLVKKISVDAVSDTQIFNVTATTDDLETSKAIIREIVKIAPKEIEKAVEAGSCKIVSDLDYLNEPVSPSVPKYTAVAAFAGFLLAMAYALFRVLSKQYILNERDASDQLQLPVLGVIPIIEEI